MNWLTENSILVLLGLVIFTAIWFVAFFVRNHEAKHEQGDKLNIDTKESGEAPIKRSSKL